MHPKVKRAFELCQKGDFEGLKKFSEEKDSFSSTEKQQKSFYLKPAEMEQLVYSNEATWKQFLSSSVLKDDQGRSLLIAVTEAAIEKSKAAEDISGYLKIIEFLLKSFNFIGDIFAKDTALMRAVSYQESRPDLVAALLKDKGKSSINTANQQNKTPLMIAVMNRVASLDVYKQLVEAGAKQDPNSSGINIWQLAASCDCPTEVIEYLQSPQTQSQQQEQKDGAQQPKGAAQSALQNGSLAQMIKALSQQGKKAKEQEEAKAQEKAKAEKEAEAKAKVEAEAKAQTVGKGASFIKGYDEFKSENYINAQTEWETALASCRDNNEKRVISFCLGECHMKLGNYGQAISSYRSAASLEPQVQKAQQYRELNERVLNQQQIQKKPLNAGEQKALAALDSLQQAADKTSTQLQQPLDSETQKKQKELEAKAQQHQKTLDEQAQPIQKPYQQKQRGAEFLQIIQQTGSIEDKKFAQFISANNDFLSEFINTTGQEGKTALMLAIDKHTNARITLSGSDQAKLIQASTSMSVTEKEEEINLARDKLGEQRANLAGLVKWLVEQGAELPKRDYLERLRGIVGDTVLKTQQDKKKQTQKVKAQKVEEHDFSSKATKELNDGNYSTAIIYSEVALAFCSDAYEKATILCNLGECHMKAGNYGKATSSYQQAILLDEGMSIIYQQKQRGAEFLEIIQMTTSIQDEKFVSFINENNKFQQEFINTRGQNNKTALMLAIEGNKAELVRWLIEQNAELPMERGSLAQARAIVGAIQGVDAGLLGMLDDQLESAGQPEADENEVDGLSEPEADEYDEQPEADDEHEADASEGEDIDSKYDTQRDGSSKASIAKEADASGIFNIHGKNKKRDDEYFAFDNGRDGENEDQILSQPSQVPASSSIASSSLKATIDWNRINSYSSGPLNNAPRSSGNKDHPSSSVPSRRPPSPS